MKIFKERRKSILLKVSRTGEVILKVPKGYPDYKIKEFLESKENWLDNKTKSATWLNDKRIELDEFKFFLLFGKKYLVQRTDEKIIKREGDVLFLPNIEKEKLNRLLRKWLKDIFYQDVVEIVQKIASTHNVKVSSVLGMRSIKKWGSFDSEFNLKLNYKICMLPLKYLNYILCHELAHSFEMNHSPKFWKKVSELDINFKSDRQELKEYAYVLSAFEDLLGEE